MFKLRYAGPYQDPSPRAPDGTVLNAILAIGALLWPLPSLLPSFPARPTRTHACTCATIVILRSYGLAPAPFGVSSRVS